MEPDVVLTEPDRYFREPPLDRFDLISITPSSLLNKYAFGQS